MATTPIWQGGDGNWNTGSNWSTGSAPGADNNVVFDGSTNVSVTTVPSTTTTNIALLQTDRTYSGDLGGSGNEIVLLADKIIHEGTGTLWWNSNTGTSKTDSIVVNSTNTTNAATIGGDEVEYITVNGGRVTISGSLSTDCNLIIGSSGIVDVTANGSLTASTLTMGGGICNSNIDWSSAVVSGGTFTQATTEVASLTCTGGTCYLNFRDPSGSEITGDLIVQNTGVVDLTQNNAGGFLIDGSLFVTGGGTLRFFQGQLTVTGNIVTTGGNYIAI